MEDAEFVSVMNSKFELNHVLTGKGENIVSIR